MEGQKTYDITKSANADAIDSVYFIGIGGIGMSALARYFLSRGARVSGYDKTPTQLTLQMEKEGIFIHYEDNVTLADKNATIVVYTPAIPAGHTELNYFVNNNYKVFKRSDMLSMVTAHSKSICVAGTHGKTTVSSMIAHILRDSGKECSAFLGGISVNYGTNFWSGSSNITVAEADEYDRSFLKLNPDIAVITSMDADHLDIYGTESAMQDAFVSFSRKLKPEGLLVCHDHLPRENELIASVKYKYSIDNSSSDVYARNLQVRDGSYLFDVVLPGKEINSLKLSMGGRHNVENAIASVAVASYLEIGDEQIRSAIASFAGVRRRFEFHIKRDDMVMIDDYAHHPSELNALINGARELYPGKKLTVVFQPHLFTRTRDFAEGFAESLQMADEILLLPIYPARELPLPGINSELIAEKIEAGKVTVFDKQTFLSWVSENRPEVLLMAGAGDIDELLPAVKDLLLAKTKK